MKLGVVGLPNVGKSTLFNAITNAGEGDIIYLNGTYKNNGYGQISIDKAIKSSLALRSKKELIEGFIERINVNTDVYNDWSRFVREQKEIDLKDLINEENLNEEETRKFLDHAFRDGQVKTTGTDIEKILPPMRRFGGDNRTERKQTIIEKISKFFEKYFGISNSESETDNEEYDINDEENTNLMVAEDDNKYEN